MESTVLGPQLQLQPLTGADGDGGAGVLHLRAGVWR
jgi:hypothetical protein